MDWVLFYLYAGICLAMMAPGIWQKDYRLQFPVLAGGAVLLMVCLPLAGLIADYDGPSNPAIRRFILMAILCQLASWAGYRYAEKFKVSSNHKFDPGRLAISSVALSVFGFFFAYQLSATDVEIAENGNWTGIATIFSTLSLVSRYGFVLAAILYFRNKDWRFLLGMIPQIVIYAKLFLAGRRSPTGEFLIIVATLFFFYRRRNIPFGVLVGGMVFLAVFSYNISEIRTNADRPLSERIESFMSSDPMKALSEEGIMEANRYVDVANAINLIDAKAWGGHYNYGLLFWNQLVFGFVPAQWVGEDVKRALQFNLFDDSLLTRYDKPNGSCDSGIAEAFMAFGYFGCGLFFLLGAAFRWLWERSVRGSVMCQLVLMLNILPGILSFSAQLWSMVNGLVNLFVFAGPFLWWSWAGRRTGGKLREGKEQYPIVAEAAR